MKVQVLENGFGPAVLRMAALGAVGITALAWPGTLSGMVYVVAGYMLLAGISGAADCMLRKAKKSRTEYVGAGLLLLLIVAGLLVTFYQRYLAGFLPLFLGGVLLAEAIVYFAIALRQNTATRLLLLLDVLIGIGGAAVCIYSFGFGGAGGLSRMWGALLLLSCAFEGIRLVSRKGLQNTD